MNWLSIVLVAFIAFLTWRAFRSGFIREIVSFCAIILATPIAGIFYDDMVPKVQPIVDNAKLANLVSFMAIWLGVVIGGQTAAHLLRTFVTMLNLGALDKLAGAVFGFAKAIVVAQVVLIVLVVYPNPDLQDSIDESPVARSLLDLTPALLSVLPASFDDAVDQFLRPADFIDVNLGGGG